jgi:hypothetical protein
MGFKEDLSIDKHSLHNEWEHQPTLFYEYGKLQANAEIEKDMLKDLLEVEKATVEKEIRKNPELFGIKGKATESAIKSSIITDKRVVIANEKYLEGAKEAKLSLAVAKAFEHRKKALEKLVELHLAGYYSKPNISKAAIKEDAGSVKQQQNASLKKRRKRR